MFSTHSFDCALEPILRKERLAELGRRLAQAIIGVCRNPQSDGSLIDLPSAHQELRQSGCASESQGKHTRSHRVEGAEVAYFLDSKLAADDLDDLVRCHPLCFVDDKKARVWLVHPVLWTDEPSGA